ncbi:MAG TPA: riboflavin synthase [Flavisolibacter sp.]|jgi:riboflavin synthase|nr:riboflavin synthase [Flavisolibacter sp.]
MFTGIIESLGEVKEFYETGTNKTFWIESPLSHTFTIDQSIAHDGVCLTVEEVRENRHRVTAVMETLQKTALDQWKPGRTVNLEQSLLPSKRLDGHFVQGHIDTVGVCEKVTDRNGSHEFTFSFPKKFSSLVIEKGSISVNGISLTVFDVKKASFKVAIIPYTYQHTNLQFLKPGDAVNLEFDLIGKYIQRNYGKRV